MDIYDVVYLSAVVVFFGMETYALLNKTEGDTVSEKTRKFFRTKTKTGAFIFLFMLGGLATWLAAHIVEIPI